MNWRFEREEIPGGYAPTDVLLKVGCYMTAEELDKRINSLAYLGWLSPAGALYACGYGGHNYVEASISKHIQPEPEAHGWVALTVSTYDKTPHWGYPTQRMTEAQEKTIVDWCLAYDLELPDFLRPDLDISKKVCYD
jgi:hypothetical protein